MTWEEQLQNRSIGNIAPCNQKFCLTPYMEELIKRTHSQALQKQFIPSTLTFKAQFSNDYLLEEEFMPVQNLIHRSRTKVIITVTNQCACYCQFCTLQRITRSGDINFDNLEQIVQYISQHPEIEDVLITGGDPLILSTSKLCFILQKISEINSVKIIRIGTRIPITLPQRINKKLIEGLKIFNNLYINIHINHPDELTTESKNAILALANAGIPLGSQTVLLKEINDNYEILRNLFLQLIQIKVKPYYLYQCDKVQGCERFIVDVQKGIDIINKLCNQITGFAIPKFVVDTPERGKMVLAPFSIDEIKNNILLLSNSDGKCTYENLK